MVWNQALLTFMRRSPFRLSWRLLDSHLISGISYQSLSVAKGCCSFYSTNSSSVECEDDNNSDGDGSITRDDIKELGFDPRTPSPVFNGHIPKEKVIVRVARSSGPGGQNVNKLNTKVDLRINIHEADWIPDEVVHRIKLQHHNRINSSGELMIQSSSHRTQEANMKDAFDKLKDIIQEAYPRPKIRKKKRDVPQYEKEKRLREKKQRSNVKSLRRGKFEC